MRLIQYLNAAGQVAVGQVVSADQIQTLDADVSLYQLAQAAMADGQSLAEAVQQRCTDDKLSYQQLIDENRLLPPLTHPDPAHLFVTGTGLTHLGSADTRDSMHAKTAGKSDAELTDSMKMFKQGVEGGKPAAGKVGVQPEWFYKGNGTIVAPPGQALKSPAFALDGGEEPEIVGCYVIDKNGQPWRLGYALGNEFSDHQTERQNYLLLAHSKLRPCSVGPELLVGDLPSDIQGQSRIKRGDSVIWQKPFVSGEANMSHSLNNLEHHHFKYALFRQPGDAHLHFFGTATLSFADGIEPQAGDVFEVEAAQFGRPLSNPLAQDAPEDVVVKVL